MHDEERDSERGGKQERYKKKKHRNTQETIVRVSDQYLDTTNNQTLAHGEISHIDNQLYHRNKG